MRDKLKNNTKIKLISLLSSIVLWLYVMAVVDPEETKLFEDIPVTIENVDDLNKNDLMIYPEDKLTTDIYITGKLSDIQKIKKDNINVYGRINNPIEGNNELYLRASISSQKVTHEFKTSVIVVGLEKFISEQKPINIIRKGNSINNIDNVKLSTDSVIVSGPRSLVKQVHEVIGTLSIDNEINNFSKKIELFPVNEKREIVEGVNLDNSNLDVTVTLLQEKEIPIIIQLKDEDQESNIKNYTLSQDNVKVKGKKEIIDKIESISTQPIVLSDILKDLPQKVYLDIPQGLLANTEFITITLNEVEKLTNEFIYTSDEIQIKNIEKEINTSTINIPQTIKVVVEYTNEISNLTKSDIKLYIDLLEQNNETTQLKIKYDTKYNLENIVIEPGTIEVNI